MVKQETNPEDNTPPQLGVDQLAAAEVVADVAVADAAKDWPAGAITSNGKGKTLGLGVVLGLVAAGLGYGAALFFPLSSPIQTQAPDLTQIEAKIEAQIAALDVSADLAQLQARIAALEAAPQPDLASVIARLDQLEARPAPAPISDSLRAEIADIRRKLTENDPTPAIKAAIQAEMGAVQQSAQDMAASVAEAAQNAARQSAMMLLQAALDTGATFEAAVSELDLPKVLADYAQSGIPSLTALKDSFPEAARAGLDAALRSDLGATWGERAMNFLRAQTGARALTPQTGNDPDAILSRINAGLRAGDMATVMAEIAALPAEARDAMADWIAQVQIRAEALAAYETLGAQGQQ